jgi:hypothetical protein
MPTQQVYGAGTHDFIVPAGTTSVTLDLRGGQGGPGNGSRRAAARVMGTLSVTPGEVLRLVVGGAGGNGQGSAGFNGGGDLGTSESLAGTGGGATDVRRNGTTLNHRVVVAGGSGGGSQDGSGAGGSGGAPDGGSGLGDFTGGGGGTQSAGGVGGASDSGLATGEAGSLGQGGAASVNGFGGGGGGGFYGGGGAGARNIPTEGGGGGGGSSLVPAGFTVTATATDVGGVAVLTYNRPPTAPNLLSPANNAALNPSQTQRFSWAFSDPDSSDSQSAYELRAGVVGAGFTYSSGIVNLPNAFHDVPAGTFGTSQSMEWQVRTADSQGAWGPFSASRFFTTQAPPPGPTVLEPTNGATLPTSSVLLRWSTSTQDAYQARVLDASTSEVLQDTGVVENAATRSVTFDNLENNRDVRLEVRTRSSGLFSAFGFVVVSVSFTPPAVPTTILETVASNPALAALGLKDAIRVTATHPTPTGTQPVVVAMDVHRRVTADGGDGIRVARDVSPVLPWTDHTPASGVDYSYRVAAVGANGTSTFSLWNA